MIYGYARVSSDDQNEARQIDALQKAGCEKIITDKYSGKNFDRPGYKRLMRLLKEGDVLFIHSLDRLGRNYDLIKEQWEYITKKRGVDIVVLDMPLLDTRKDKNLIGAFISDIVLQLLAFVSQMERDNIRKRQAEGIKLAVERGVRFGPRPKPVPENFETVCQEVRDGSLSCTEGAEECGMKRTTFITKFRIWEFYTYGEHKTFVKGGDIAKIPPRFSECWTQYKRGEIASLHALAKELGISEMHLKRYYRTWARCINGQYGEY